ncbi:MAG: DNA-binding protein [Prevotella sp.]|nr:DNA-binding protein [Prevotella sp.]
MAVKVYLSKNNNEKSDSFGRYYAYADNNKPIGIRELANHMTSHGSPFSEGTISGIITDMVKCIRELSLNGQPVKLDDLAIFSAHIENHGGWASLEDVDLSMGGATDNIQALRLCAQATGAFTKAELTSKGSVELNREWRNKVADARKDSESGNQNQQNP